MRRLAKPAGRYNLVLEEVPVPEPGPTEVRVKAVRSLISRGSEIGRRYTRDEAIDPQMMGYSMSGVVDAVGESVTHLDVGDRVVVSAPHADYVVQRRDDRLPRRPSARLSHRSSGGLRRRALLVARQRLRHLGRRRGCRANRHHRHRWPGPGRQPAAASAQGQRHPPRSGDRRAGPALRAGA